MSYAHTEAENTAMLMNIFRNSADKSRMFAVDRTADVTECIFELGEQKNVTDIHFEPEKNGAVRLRFRTDGVLHDFPAMMPASLWDKVLQRIKVAAKMDTAQRRRPEDGHIIRRLKGGKVKDCRVASIPTRNGEKIVLRIFAGADRLFNIDELDFYGDNAAIFRSLVNRPSGLTIITGPMNSGKTTSIYAALNELNVPDISIATVEDPVEITLDGVTQCEVTDRMSFADGLRGLLRMDCDTLLIGEIRDEETAQIAVRAALTGHRIFTSLHAGDCLGALLRLADLGVKWSNIAAVLSGVVAQRLVRRLCGYCREQRADGFFVAKGCQHCHQTGYSGRLPIHEIFVPDFAVRSMINACAGQVDMLRDVLTKNFVPLAADGTAKAKAGLTTVEELRRTLGEEFYGRA